MVYDGQIDPTLILFGKKAWFHSRGYANSQNNCMLIYHMPLHDSGWCVVCYDCKQATLTAGIGGWVFSEPVWMW